METLHLLYLDACLQAGMAVVQVEAHHPHPVGPVREPWPWKGAWLEASIQEEEQEGNLEAACLSTKKLDLSIQRHFIA